MPSIKVTWRTSGDSNVCPICQAINGYTWIFKDQPMPDTLIHPVYGEVWNSALGSLAHEHFSAKQGGYPGFCRCHWDTDIDVTDLLKKTQKFAAEIKATYGAGEIDK